MKKIKKMCMLFCLMCTALVLAGCEDYVEFSNFYIELKHNGNYTNVQNYTTQSNLNNLEVEVVNNEPQVLSYKVVMMYRHKDSSDVKNVEVQACTSQSNGNYKIKLPGVEANYWYQVTVTGYTGEACSGEKDSEYVTIQTYVDGASNEQYISVENIKDKLGDYSYTNKSGGSEVSCASYGIEDKETNVPLCVALARKGSSATDCADFLKLVYKLATGVQPSSIYSKGTRLGSEYTSMPAIIPAGLKDGDLITLWNGSNYAHIGMVFYWDNKSEWYVVHGNWSNKVAVTSLEDTLKGANTWTKYIFRSQ